MSWKIYPRKLIRHPPRLLNRFRFFVLTLHLAYATERTYAYWLQRYIYFHIKSHPELMGTVEVRKFLDYLAVSRNVSISIQKTALKALVFFITSFCNGILVRFNLIMQRNRRTSRLFLRAEMRPPYCCNFPAFTPWLLNWCMAPGSGFPKRFS